MTSDGFDYIVVGSGAGGGPVAANLAKAGMRVLLLEAGGDEENYHYQVPCFHGLASEDQEYSWEFFVRHYADDAQQARDTKYRAERGGVFYPRAGTLGGCTAHNAMITVYPHDADWDAIAALTRDPSWGSKEMRRYFLRLERSDYARRPWGLPRNRALAALLGRLPLVSRLFDRSEHGFNGWLHTALPDPKLGLTDLSLLQVLGSAAREALATDLGRSLDLVEDLLLFDPKAYVDPNTRDAVPRGRAGIWLAPLAIHGARRNGTREYLKWVARTFPENLEIRLNALATRVLFDGERAVGVEYLDAAHAYRADPRCADPPAGEQPRREVRCSREVILAGGAFNTPQLLKLSGIGPRDELESFGIECRVDRPGVGENLQDRYEVGVVTEMNRDFSLLEGLTFAPPLQGAAPDPAFREWLEGKGLYATNGAVLAVVRKSARERPLPDLFVFGLPATFKGYYPGYSQELEHRRNRFTWAVLKAHTNNSAGYVRLRSADPRDVPEINFRYFDEGNDAAGEDLESVVDGVLFARDLMKRAAGQVRRELWPGPRVATRDEIRDFVRAEAWGHHASCTCRMGPSSDRYSVVDNRFRVHGTSGLRVVDASVFPHIPGFFIVSAVYMIAEKASDVILEDVPGAELRRRQMRRLAPRAARRLTGMSKKLRTRQKGG